MSMNTSTNLSALLLVVIGKWIVSDVFETYVIMYT